MDILRAEDFRQNLYSFFVIRFFFLLALFFAFFLVPLINEQPAIFTFRNKILLVLIFFFVLLNFLSLVFNRIASAPRIRPFAYIEFFIEILFWVLVAYLSGGIESPYLYVVAVMIMYSGFILDAQGALFTMATGFFLLLLMAFLVKSSVLPVLSLDLVELYGLSWSSFFSKLAVYLFFFAVAGAIATRTARAIQRVNRELLEKELRTEELKNHFYAILSSLSMGVVIIRERRILYANEFARKVCPDLEAFVAEVVKGPYVYQEWQERRWGGRILHYSVQRYVEQQEVLIFSDVTVMRQREEENRRREKMAVVGQLTASIAHEIKNPLASLIGASEMLSSSLHGVDDDTRQLSEIIAREGERVKNLLDRLFFSTEEPPLIISDVPVRSLLESIVRMFSVSYPRIRVEMAMGDIAILGDADRLREVFWNILINAAEAMREEGTITIHGDVKDGMLIVRIADSGGGIPSEVMERIFDPFFSTKQRGTGLGLAVVHNVVRMHGGEVTARNTDVGAEFLVTLPLRRG